MPKFSHSFIYMKVKCFRFKSAENDNTKFEVSLIKTLNQLNLQKFRYQSIKFQYYLLYKSKTSH